MIAVKNGLVKTMTSLGDIENGQVLIENGKILAVGKDLEIPSDAKVIDAKDMIVTPGFVEGHCHLGIWEDGVGDEGEDSNEMTDPVTPQLRALDAINPMDTAFREAMEAGITTVITGPGSANVMGGTFLAMKTYGHRIDDMILKDPVAMKIAFGENPKSIYGTKGKMPGTRMANASLLREVLYKAKGYLEKKERAKGDPDKMPEYDLKMEALIPVLKKEIPLKAHAHRADDIFTAIRIAKEFDVGLTLDHVTEGHLIADDLAKEGRGCLVGPSLISRSKIEVKNKTFETPNALYQKGIKIGIITDANVIPEQYLPLCAGLAVNSGLPEEEAWKAITINSAEIVGVADRVGSLEKGKDGDIAIYEGNPMFDVNAKCRCVIVDGVVRFKKD